MATNRREAAGSRLLKLARDSNLRISSYEGCCGVKIVYNFMCRDRPLIDIAQLFRFANNDRRQVAYLTFVFNTYQLPYVKILSELEIEPCSTPIINPNSKFRLYPYMVSVKELVAASKKFLALNDSELAALVNKSLKSNR